MSESVTEPLLVWQCKLGYHTWGKSICIACGVSRQDYSPKEQNEIF